MPALEQDLIFMQSLTHSYITDITTPSLFQCSSVLTEREIGKRSPKYSLLKKVSYFSYLILNKNGLQFISLAVFPVSGKEWHLVFFRKFHRFHSRVLKWFLPFCSTILGSYPVVSLVLSTNKSTMLAVLKFSLLMEKLRTCMFLAFLK